MTEQNGFALFFLGVLSTIFGILLLPYGTVGWFWYFYCTLVYLYIFTD